MPAMNEIEEVLGRPFKPAEKIIYDIYKDNRSYHFEIEESSGVLIAVINQEAQEK